MSLSAGLTVGQDNFEVTHNTSLELDAVRTDTYSDGSKTEMGKLYVASAGHTKKDLSKPYMGYSMGVNFQPFKGSCLALNNLNIEIGYTEKEYSNDLSATSRGGNFIKKAT